MITLLASPLARWLAGALVAVSAVSGAYTLGRVHGSEARALAQSEADGAAYAEIIKEMENADLSGDDPGDVLRRLCELAGGANIPQCRDL